MEEIRRELKTSTLVRRPTSSGWTPQPETFVCTNLRAVSSVTPDSSGVWLPPGYDEGENSGRRYPVLYLNDGQNLFEPSTSFTGVEWGVDETADRLIRDRVVPPMIIVGIDNTGKDRFREYMPHRSLQPVMLRVQGQRYPNFLIKRSDAVRRT